MPEERIVFNDPEEARAWDMYACANIGCGGWDMMFECADMMLLERRKRMAPEKVEREWIPQWITHKPGDPMPCDGDDWVVYKLSDSIPRKAQAKQLNWSLVTGIASHKPGYRPSHKRGR